MSVTLTQILSAPATESDEPSRPRPRLRLSVPKIQEGDVLADRFEVIRSLGSGGMGEVFEATDRVIGEAVAVKIVRAPKAHSEVDRARLLREVQLARRVTHPNVCRTFDIFRHQMAPAPDQKRWVDVVSMELLNGVDLGQRLKSEGRFTLDEALPSIRQIARGLFAAHRQGIVHRDLKPGNIMLVDEKDGQRAVITDFGLARLPDVDDSLTKASEILGSPAYMAPEQIAGTEVSAATDVYGFGVIIYEMLSGHLPFVGEGPWLTAISRLHRDPEPITVWVPDLDPRMISLIDRCLAREVGNRLSGMEELLEVLDFGDPRWHAYGLKGQTRTPVAQRDGADAPSIGDAAAGKEANPDEGESPSADDSSPGSLKSLASSQAGTTSSSVSSFPGGALPDSSSTELRIPGSPSSADIAELFGVAPRELPPRGAAPERGRPAASTLENPAATRAVETISDEMLRSAGVDPTAKPKSRLAVAAGVFGLVAIVGLFFFLRGGEGANRAGGYGLDWRTQVVPFATTENIGQRFQAVEANPGDPEPLILLLEGLRDLGRDGEAAEYARQAREILPGLEASARTELEAAAAAAEGAWASARDLYFSLTNLYPESFGYWMRYVEARVVMGDHTGLEEIIEAKMDSLSEAAQIRAGLWRTQLLPMVEGLDEAERLFVRAERLGDKRLMLEARLFEAGGKSRTGRLPEARLAAQQAVAIAEELGPFSRANAKYEFGSLVWKEGELAEATAYFDDAFEVFQEIQNWIGLCNVHNARGVMMDGGPEREAELATAIDFCHRSGHRLREGLILFNLANISEPARAVEKFRDLAAIAEEIDEESLLGLSMVGLGALLVEFGETNQALVRIEQAEKIFREPIDRFGMFAVLAAKMTALRQAGDLAGAARALQQAEVFVGGRYELNLLLNQERVEQALFEGKYSNARQAAERLREQWHEVDDHASEYEAWLSAVKAGMADNYLTWAGAELTRLSEHPGLRSQQMAKIHTLRAEVEWQLGNRSESLAALARAREVAAPDYFKYLNWRLALLAAYQDPAKALSGLEMAAQEASAAGNEFWRLVTEIAISDLRDDQDGREELVKEAEEAGLIHVIQLAEAPKRHGTPG